MALVRRGQKIKCGIATRMSEMSKSRREIIRDLISSSALGISIYGVFFRSEYNPTPIHSPSKRKPKTINLAVHFEGEIRGSLKLTPVPIKAAPTVEPNVYA